MDWLQNNIVYFFGWNGALQSGVVALLGVIISVGVSWYIARKKIEMEKENYTEQVRQFEDNLANERLKIYKELITKENIKWVVDLRNNIVSYLGMLQYLMQKRMTYVLNDRKNGIKLGIFLKQIEDDFTNLMKLYYAIVIMLNQNDSSDGKDNIISLKKEIILINKKVGDVLRDEEPGTIGFDNTDNDIKKFSELCQEFLRDEWSNVKKEARSI